MWQGWKGNKRPNFHSSSSRALKHLLLSFHVAMNTLELHNFKEGHFPLYPYSIKWTQLICTAAPPHLPWEFYGIYYILAVQNTSPQLASSSRWLTSWSCHVRDYQEDIPGAQWIRIRQPKQGTQAQFLVQEDSICQGVTKPCATITEPTSCNWSRQA